MAQAGLNYEEEKNQVVSHAELSLLRYSVSVTVFEIPFFISKRIDQTLRIRKFRQPSVSL